MATTTTRTCTVRYATTGLCGKPAVRAEGEYAECEAHVTYTTMYPTRGEVKAAAARYCRKAACVEEAMGHEFVGHLAGTCG